MDEHDIKIVERLTRLEAQVTALTVALEKQSSSMEDLLALKNKGAGIFWSASVLFGIVISLASSFVINLFRGG